MNRFQDKGSKLIIVLLVAVLFLVNLSCQASSNAPVGTQTATTTVTVTITATRPTMTPTLTLEIIEPSTSTPSIPSPTLTPAAPFTPVTPNPTGVSQAASTLINAGPWLLIGGENGLWASNQDSTGIVRLDDQPLQAPHDLSKAISPQGGYVAYITYGDLIQKRDPVLKILKLPQGIIQNSIHLTSNKTVPQTGAGIGDTAFEANRAVLDADSLAWSPDGNTLAFIGAQEGSSADLYIYRVDEDRVYRLTSEYSQAYRPVWSSDGVYITYWGVKSFGTGKGYLMDKAWSVVVDGAVVVELYEINGQPLSNEEQMHGWVSNREIVVGSWNASCGSYNLRKVNVKNGVETDLVPTCYSSAALDQNNAELIYGVSDYDVNYCSCSKTTAERGVYLLPNGRSLAQQLNQENVYEFSWLEKADMFLAAINDGWDKSFTSDGRVVTLPENVKNIQPVVSPISGKWAWAGTALDGEKGVWVGDPKEKPARVYNGSSNLAAWSPDGLDLFFWTEDGQFFNAKAPDFNPSKLDNLAASSAAWVNP